MTLEDKEQAACDDMLRLWDDYRSVTQVQGIEVYARPVGFGDIYLLCVNRNTLKRSERTLSLDALKYKSEQDRLGYIVLLVSGVLGYSLTAA